MTAAASRERRLIIAATSLGGAEAALAYCRAILEWFPATPTGLIIEPDSAAYQTSLGHRLVSSNGTLLTIPSPDQLRRIAKGDAKALRTRLSYLAANLNADSGCELAKGDLVHMACVRIVEDDVLMLGQRPMLACRGKVLLLASENGAADASHGLAYAIAQDASTTVTILSAEHPAATADLIDRIDRSHASAVIVDFKSGPLRSEDDLRRIFAAARCPVVVLGASCLRRAKAKEALE